MLHYNLFSSVCRAVLIGLLVGFSGLVQALPELSVFTSYNKASGLTVELQGRNTPPAGRVDVYLVVEMPDGRYLSYPGWREGLRPWLRNEFISGDFNYSRQVAVRVPYSRGHPEGQYRMYIGFTRPGTLDIYALASTTFTVRHDDEGVDPPPLIREPIESIQPVDLPNNDEKEKIVCGAIKNTFQRRVCVVQQNTRKVFKLDAAGAQATEIPGTFVDDQGAVRSGGLRGPKKGLIYLANTSDVGRLLRGGASASATASGTDVPASDESGKTAIFAYETEDNTLGLLSVDVIVDETTGEASAVVEQTPTVVPGRPPQENPQAPLPKDDDNSPAKARPLQNVGFPQSVSSLDDPDDYYAVDGFAGSLVSFELRFGQPDLDLLVYDASGALVDQAVSRSGSVERLQLPTERDRRYIVRVRAYDTAGLPVEYSLAVDRAPLTTDADGNGSPGEAESLSFSGYSASVSDRLAENDLQDFWTFQAQESTRHVMALTGFTGNLDLVLYEAPDKRLAASTRTGSEDERIERQLQAGKRYYLRVGGSNPASSYRLAVAFDRPPVDDNNSFGTAGALDTPLSSSVENGIDFADYWRFTAPESALYTFSSNNSKLTLRLYSAQQVLRKESKGGGISDKLTAGQTYYVRIDAANTTGEQAYRLDSSFEPDVVDADNSCDAATQIARDASRSSSVNTFDDQWDYWAFKPGECRTQTVTIQFGSDANLDLFLASPGGDVIASSAGGSLTNRRESVTLGPDKLLANQYHCVGVFAAETSEREDYSLSLSSSLISDSDDTADEAVAIGDRGSFRGSLGPCDAVDWLKFTPKETGSYDVSLTAGASSGVTVAYYAAGELLGTGDSSAYLYAGEEYRLKVYTEGSVQEVLNYEISITPPEPPPPVVNADVEYNGDKANANTIDLGDEGECVTVKGTLESFYRVTSDPWVEYLKKNASDAYDWFTVKTQQGGDWSIRLSFDKPDANGVPDLDLGGWSSLGVPRDYHDGRTGVGQELIERVSLEANKRYDLNIGAWTTDGVEAYTLEFCPLPPQYDCC